MLLQYFCVLLYLQLVLSKPTPVKDLEQPPRFSLNLDLPEEERWRPILEHWDIKEFQNLVQEIMGSFTTTETKALLEIIGGVVEKFLPSPYAGEIKGIANYFEMKVGEIVFMNVFYSVSTGCTSIVAQDSDGNIWHARNMDFDFTMQLRNLTTVVDFKSKGKTMYTTTTFLGQCGAFTGQRPNGFTVSLNQRINGSIAENIVQILKALIFKKTVFTSFLIRDALYSEDTPIFDSALSLLANQSQTAPNYYIIGGVKPKEGAVVTRNPISALDVWRLAPDQGRWFVLETNYDHWNLPPKDDDRRDPGNKAMNGVGQDDINLPSLLKVLSVKLVCNPTTIYTTLMSAAHPDSYVTYMRSCK